MGWKSGFQSDQCMPPLYWLGLFCSLKNILFDLVMKVWTAKNICLLWLYFSGRCGFSPIESGPSDPKKWGLYRRSVKKCRFSGQNRAPAAAPRPAVQRDQHKNVVFLLSGHDGNKKVGRFWQKNGFWAKKLHFRPEILHFFTLHLWNPHFFSSNGHDSMGS